MGETFEDGKVAAHLDLAIVCGIEEFNAAQRKYAKLLSKVTRSDNWKLPIDALIEVDPFEAGQIAYAIQFFTGSTPNVRYFGNIGNSSLYQFKSAGYYGAVGA